MRYDYVYIEDLDSSLHYVNGKYVGHDDQFDPLDHIVPTGYHGVIEVHNWQPRDDVSYDVLESAMYEDFNFMRPFLQDTIEIEGT